MSTADLIWNGAAALLTLCVFSFLYKDNAFYRFAEHLVLGISAGYWTIILYYNGLHPDLIDPIFSEGKYYYFIPAFLGLLVLTRFSKRHSWPSRYALGIFMGIASGAAIPLYLQAYVIRQAHASVAPYPTILQDGSWWDVVKLLLVTVGVIGSLIYFYFSAEHKGVLAGLSRIGIWVLMIGFGAGFGMTVMGRISLLIDRFQFLRDYAHTLFG